MKIVSWNVNGLRSAWDNGFMDFVEKEKPDVLCLQEIKVDESLVESLEIEGYGLYHNCANKKGYSGVAVYCREAPLSVELDLEFERFDGEGRMLVLKFKDFTLINLYLPHGGRGFENLNYKMESYNFMMRRIRNFLDKGERVVVCGDFNIAREEIDLARPKNNLKNIMFSEGERMKLKEFVDLGFMDCFREIKGNEVAYSWWPYMANCRGRNIGWRIDYVFASDGVEIGDAFYLKDVLGSDHCPVGVEVF